METTLFVIYGRRLELGTSVDGHTLNPLCFQAQYWTYEVAIDAGHLRYLWMLCASAWPTHGHKDQEGFKKDVFSL